MKYVLAFFKFLLRFFKQYNFRGAFVCFEIGSCASFLDIFMENGDKEV